MLVKIVIIVHGLHLYLFPQELNLPAMVLLPRESLEKLSTENIQLKVMTFVYT